MTENMPLHFFDTYFRSENEELAKLYTYHWNKIPSHYPAGWCYGFWEPNRFLNRVIYHHLTSKEERASVLDFACYDGLLVRALFDQGFDAFGYEALPCYPMFEALGIKERINQKRYCEVVIAFGIAHEYYFKDFMRRVEEENNGVPEVVFFDREPTRPTTHCKTYFDPLFIAKEGIKVVKFPNCISDRSKADLLIWKAEE